MSDPLARALEHHRAGRLEEAEAGYRAVLEREPRDPNASYLLAMIAIECGYLADGVELTMVAVTEAPEVAAFWSTHGDALAGLARNDEAIAAYRRSMDLDADRLQPHFNLGLLLHRMDRHDQAAVCFEHVLELEPEHPTALHLLAAMRGGAPSSSPPAYVAGLFDNYASVFDRHLTGTLAYCVPPDLCAMLPADGDGWLVLDLGCGTGLVGPCIRDRAGRLVGCDLSAGMLRVAAQKNVYDELHLEDLAVTLGRFDGEVDAIVAADVLIYVGEPRAMLAASARALRPGGWLALSIEEADEPLVLRRSGRFAHGIAAFEEAAARAGLCVEQRRATAVRVEASVPIAGHLFLLRKPGSVA